MARIEAGLIFYGYEFNDQTDPFESGIGFSVALKTKEDDFVGKEALIKRLDKDSTILIKGSRAMKMERIVNALMKDEK